VWAFVPLACAAACLLLFFFLLISDSVPPGPCLLLEVSAVIALIVGSSAFASVLWGAALLEEQSDSEPLRFQEAGWILGLPVGILVALVMLLASPPSEGGNTFKLYALPLLISIAFCATLWAVLTRVLLRREALTRDDYACAAFIAPVEYAPLARRKQAWRAARDPRKLTPDEARAHLPDIVHALAEQLEKTRDDVPGNHIMELLGALGEASVAPELIAALGSKRPSNRRVAAIALGKLGVLESLPALADHVTEDQEAMVRRAAVVALGKLDSAMAVPTLLKALEDKEPSVRQSACVALGNLRAQEALPALCEAAKEAKATVRQSATKAIERISGQAPQVEDAVK